MADVFDILLDNDGDLMFADGDLVCGESTAQHQQLLLMINKGELKQHPLTGIGAESYLLDDDYLKLKHEIEAQFERDGMTIKQIQINDKIQINAEYEG